MKANIIKTSLSTALLKLLTVAVFLTFSFSCSEDDPINTRKYGGKITMTADGQEISLSKNSIYVYQGIFSFESYAESASVKVEIGSGIAETTYEIDPPNVVFRYSGNIAESGVFTITEINEQTRTMSGTFAVTVPTSSGKIDVENGTFTNVPYVVQKERSGNQPVATIDGVELRGTSPGGNPLSVNYTSGYKILYLAFPYTSTPVTYDVTSFTNEYDGVTYVDGLYTYKAISGNISITLHDVDAKHIEGTFEAVVESVPVPGITKSITGGAFSFTY
jgi:hypothetical protein